MRVFEIERGGRGLDWLHRRERPEPVAGHNEVLVRMRAASLNYRDIAILTGHYFSGPVDRDTVPLSDGAGEVVAVGDGVERCKIGDRVVATFFQPPSGAPLGSPLDGALTEYAVFDQRGLLHMPSNLSFEEAATLPCAGVTAWNALIEGKRIKPGDSVLVLGTGGVSMLALQIAKAAGARVIATSSSDEKLERARQLGADVLINYKATPDWAQAVLEAADGRGVDHIVEVGGAGTLPSSYRAIGPRGEIALIGVLTQPEGDLRPHPMMLKGASLRGIFVGDRAMFEDLNRAIEVNDIHPAIDTVFDFDDAPQAYSHMIAARHFAKIVVRI
jgi:NADPH:quinone reductase-like Zn-dependent oxidoreductase